MDKQASDHENSDLIKTREIFFRDPHPDACQAVTVVELFQALDCIRQTTLIHQTGISVTYDIHCTCLQELEETLIELGFHLDDNLLAKLKRALYYYTEETQRANLGITHDQENKTRKVFINRYQNIEHGCRDERPDCWRKYL